MSRAAAFGAALLAPLLATYCAALPLAVEALRQAPGGALPANKLLRCIQVRVQALAGLSQTLRLVPGGSLLAKRLLCCVRV